MKTSDRILDAALEMFNEQGTGAVSTNHIAAAAGISPGNLYYHFRNKEEIVRALFERLFAFWDSMYPTDEDWVPSLGDIEGIIRANFRGLWQHRFIYRELLVLLQKDEALHKRWVDIRLRRFEGFRELVAAFSAAGVLRDPGDPAAVERLAELVWLVSEFWLASVEVSGKVVDTGQVERGIAFLYQVLDPFTVAPLEPTS